MVDGQESVGPATIATDNMTDSRFGQDLVVPLGQCFANHFESSVGGERHGERWAFCGDNLVGRGVQPFMLGIKTLQMSYGSLIDDASTASSYKDLAAGAANWILNVGYDPLLKAVSYGRVFPQCEPAMTEVGDPSFGFRIPDCIENSANPDAVSTARVRNSEVQNAVRVAYQANPTGEVKAQGDQMYCAQWGNAALTKPGYCTEPITASNLTDANLAAYKWTGFFFGVGMAHQWPAVRVGGVSPPMPQTVPVNVDLSQAASARITVTQPSSATTQYLCSSSPCQVVVDARQGAHWAQIDYLSIHRPGPLVAAADFAFGHRDAHYRNCSYLTPAPAPAVTSSPSFNLAGGSYTASQSVTISTTTAGASIRYTTDGTLPTSTMGTVYSGPVSVSGNLTLKAIAYASGMTSSSVTTATYTITSVVTGSGSGTSSVSVTSSVTPWYDSAWTNRKAVTIDHTKVPGNLANFPLLFSITDVNLKTVANGGQVGRSDGADVLFTSADGVTKLDHELDSYNSSTGQVSAWVRLPAISATADTVIYVYYGNASALDQQNRAGVWDSDYKLVWHLGDGTVVNPTDSTGNRSNGVSYGAGGVAGKIAGGAAGIVEAIANNLVTGDQSRTLECWFKIRGNLGSDQVICGMGYDTGTGTMFTLMYRAAGSLLSLDAKGIAQSFPWTYDANWHHLAATYTSGSGLQNAGVYLDGVKQTTNGGSGTLVAQFPSYFDVEHSPGYPWNDMAGTVDEFRVSGTARSASWIATEYSNQNSPSTFFSVGGQEPGNSSQIATSTLPPVSSPPVTSAPVSSPPVSSAPVTSTGSGANSAAFVKTDTTTQGSWKGVYGSQGYNVISNAVSYPGYATVTPYGYANYTWAGSTSDVRALQKALSPADRLAATWYSAASFTIDLNFTDGAQHQVAIYCVDWDSSGRKQTVSILDGATNAVLDSQNVSSFQNGKYLVWNLTGHVILRVTNTSAANTVVSGLFFDPSNFDPSNTVATPTNSGGIGGGNTAAFVKTDTATQGSWKGVYGSQGYNVISNAISYPGYAAVTPYGYANYTWAGSTSDVRALQKALSPADRLAATWYSAASFTIDLNFTDGAQHQVAIYCVDWDSSGRKQTVSILDGATNAVLDSQNVSSFQNGKYLVWNLTGHVILRATNTSAANTVISGLFFDPANTVATSTQSGGIGGGNTAAFVKTDTATMGTWKGAYGANGYNVISDTVSYPGYVTVTPTGQSNYIWAGSTSDVRALQKALSSTRTAATWYTSGTFTVDLNFNDGAQHQLAVYCLDWDWGGARKQMVSILDGATNAVLDTQTVTGFQNGKYLVWNLTGHVKLRVTNTAGINAVISGLFFDPANAAH